MFWGMWLTEDHCYHLFSETKKKPSIKEIIDLIIFSYEKLFLNLNSYNYVNFKKKADLMVAN